METFRSTGRLGAAIYSSFTYAGGPYDLGYLKRFDCFH